MPITLTGMRQHVGADATVKRWVVVQNVVRKDLRKFYWTSHNEEIVYPHGGPTYEPDACVNVSAVRQESENADVNASLRGAMNSSHVTADDVRAGMWNGARITQRILDWQTPFFDEILRSTFYINEGRWDAEKFEFDVEGVAHFFQTEIGVVVNRHCRHIFAGAAGAASSVVGCRAAITGSPETQTAVAVDVVTDNQTFTLNSGTYTTQADDYYNFGTLRFTTGANKGVPAITVDDYVNATDGVVLTYPAPFDVASGDRLTLQVGCDRKYLGGCTTWSQTAYFGGFYHVPSKNELADNPRSKD